MGESFTIQISSKLVKQLADEGEKSKKKTTRKLKPKPKVQPQTRVQHQKQHVSIDSDMHHKGGGSSSSSSAGGWSLPPPLYLPFAQPATTNAELEAIKSVVQESDKVIQRLQKQEEDMVREVTQRAKDLRDKEFKLPYQKPVPCVAEIDACLECYKDNVNNPLKCGSLVKTFADCARKVRQQAS